MSQIAIENFLGRIITDRNFRERAMNAPEVACSSEGFVISAHEMVYLKTLDFSLIRQIAETIDGAIRRS